MLQEIMKLKKGANPENVELLINALKGANSDCKVDIIGLREGVTMIVGNSVAKDTFDRFNIFAQVIEQVRPVTRAFAPRKKKDKEEADIARQVHEH